MYSGSLDMRLAPSALGAPNCRCEALILVDHRIWGERAMVPFIPGFDAQTGAPLWHCPLSGIVIRSFLPCCA